MLVIAFDEKDVEYLTWARQHPNGYLINSRRTSGTSYAVLHRVECKTLKDSTTNKRKKFCSEHFEDLRSWAEKERPGAELRYCFHCSPGR